MNVNPPAGGQMTNVKCKINEGFAYSKIFDILNLSTGCRFLVSINKIIP